jgi:hypothetical protein
VDLKAKFRANLKSVYFSRTVQVLEARTEGWVHDIGVQGSWDIMRSGVGGLVVWVVEY